MTSTLQLNPNRWLMLPVILTAAFMAIVDVFIVNVAAPSIQTHLHASADEVQWLMAVYVLAYALGLITGGRLGDIYGRRRLFQIGLAGFTISSALCGAAPTPTTLLGARFLQGSSAALMFPQMLSMIQVEFAPEERAKCFALMGGVQGAGAILGQVLGGGLISLNVLGLDWRSVFLINVPVGIAALIAAQRLVPESRSDSARRLDLGGVALGSLVLGLVVFPLVEGRQAGWPWWVPVAFAAALPVGALWVAHERRVHARGGSPLVELELFRERSFGLGVGLVLLFWMVTSFFLLLGLYLQDGLGYSPIAAGLLFLPLAVTFVVASLNSGRLLSSIPHERVLAAGAATVTVGLVISALAAAGTVDGFPAFGLIVAFVLIGAGNGLFMPTAIGAVLRHIPAHAAGSASGVLSTAQQIGNALGVTVAGTAFFSVLGSHTGPAAYGNALSAGTFVAVGVTAASALLALGLRQPAASVVRGSAGDGPRGARGSGPLPVGRGQ
jgi:EmrB/QacA subfamily drug resistance transporter